MIIYEAINYSISLEYFFYNRNNVYFYMYHIISYTNMNLRRDNF